MCNMCKMGFGVGLSSRASSSWRPVLHFLRNVFQFPIEKNINFFFLKIPKYFIGKYSLFTRSLRSGVTNYVISLTTLYDIISW
jgi:hypothetical protein